MNITIRFLRSANPGSSFFFCLPINSWNLSCDHSDLSPSSLSVLWESCLREIPHMSNAPAHTSLTMWELNENDWHQGGITHFNTQRPCTLFRRHICGCVSVGTRSLCWLFYWSGEDKGGCPNSSCMHNLISHLSVLLWQSESFSLGTAAKMRNKLHRK